MDENWQEVFSTSQPWQAEMAKQILEENGIAAVVVKPKRFKLSFGEINVYTELTHADQAKELLKELKG